MTLFRDINLISVLIAGTFLAPILTGLFQKVTGKRIISSFTALISTCCAAASAFASVIAAEAIFANNGDNPIGRSFKTVPILSQAISGQDIFIYGLLTLLIFIILNSLLRLMTYPLLKKILTPLSVKLGAKISAANSYVRHLIAGLWHFPKSVGLVLALAMLFSLYSSVSNNSAFEGYVRSSGIFRFVNNNAVEPILSSEPMRQIPVIFNDTVDKAVSCLSPEGRKLLMRVYINGATVEDAIQSNTGIDNTAIDLVNAENDDYRKAEIIYNWIWSNISYDHIKAKLIEVDAFGVTSGAVTAFGERKGVCFDIACLNVAMCRAVGVKIRLVTGHAYNGSAWLDHSWNQIYDDKACRWVNVDATFGSKDNDYFDPVDFLNNHKDAEIQGEW